MFRGRKEEVAAVTESGGKKHCSVRGSASYLTVRVTVVFCRGRGRGSSSPWAEAKHVSTGSPPGFSSSPSPTLLPPFLSLSFLSSAQIPGATICPPAPHREVEGNSRVRLRAAGAEVTSCSLSSALQDLLNPPGWWVCQSLSNLPVSLPVSPSLHSHQTCRATFHLRGWSLPRAERRTFAGRGSFTWAGQVEPQLIWRLTEKDNNILFCYSSVLITV